MYTTDFRYFLTAICSIAIAYQDRMARRGKESGEVAQSVNMINR